MNATPLAQRQQTRKRTLTESSQFAEAQEQIQQQRIEQQKQVAKEQTTPTSTRKRRSTAKGNDEFENVDTTGRILYMLKELETESSRLDFMHTSITDQISRLQIEERILETHLRQIETNSAPLSRNFVMAMNPDELTYVGQSYATEDVQYDPRDAFTMYDHFNDHYGQSSTTDFGAPLDHLTGQYEDGTFYGTEDGDHHEHYEQHHEETGDYYTNQNHTDFEAMEDEDGNFEDEGV